LKWIKKRNKRKVNNLPKDHTMAWQAWIKGEEKKGREKKGEKKGLGAEFPNDHS